MQKVIPFLMFNDQSEAAMNFYVSVFKNARIIPAGAWARRSRQLRHVRDRGPAVPLL